MQKKRSLLCFCIFLLEEETAKIKRSKCENKAEQKWEKRTNTHSYIVCFFVCFTFCFFYIFFCFIRVFWLLLSMAGAPDITVGAFAELSRGSAGLSCLRFLQQPSYDHPANAIPNSTATQSADFTPPQQNRPSHMNMSRFHTISHESDTSCFHLKPKLRRKLLDQNVNS